MRGVLLRSGKSEQFTALGETGQPVYRAALQLREAIRRKNPDHPELVEHLAIPKTDELGSNIDWYSERPGDVIPWSSATEEEREPARAQLEVLQRKIADLSNELLGLDANGQLVPGRKPGAQGDRTVFGKLLTCVVPFPDENYVYLVDGKPVLTFWGFIHAGAERSRQPLHCLYPNTAKAADPVAPKPVAPLAPPPAAVPVANEVVKRSWWRHLFWLLPLLLLLAFLLFGLRGCWPGLGFGGLPQVDLSNQGTPTHGLTTTNRAPTVDQGAVVGNGTGVNPPEGGAVAAGQNLPGAPEAGSAAAPPGGAPEASTAPASESQPEAAPASEPGNQEPAQIPAEQTPPAPPELPADGPQQPSDVVIPADAGNGAADFLNGNWNGAGLQEVGSAKPLRLKYDIHNGKGQATVSRSDGVRCSAPVAATMNAGTLSINSEGQASCADGSSYEIPQVNCKPGAQNITNCAGNYGAKDFQMLMKQAGQ